MQHASPANERPRRRPAPRGDSKSKLVVYDPNNKNNGNGNGNGVAAQQQQQQRPPHPQVRAPNRQRQKVSNHEGPPKQQQQQHPLQHAAPAAAAGGPKIRAGDVRQLYKVLPIVIGSGSFGTVRSCIHRQSKTKLAIKSISFRGDKNNGQNSTLVKNEIALHQRVHHENVVKVMDVIGDKEYIHIIMEQCRGGDLFDRTVDDSEKRLGESRIRKIVGCLLDAVGYLHERNIVHRDLKAEHLMFASSDPNSTIKIIDFGVACHHPPNSPPITAFAGSLRSMAPEVIKRSYGRECDMWSVGVITYFLLLQQMPFDSELEENVDYQNDVFRKIVAGKYYYPQWAAKGLSEEAKSFIDGLLVVDPKRRMSARQALMHPWIRGNTQSMSTTTKQQSPVKLRQQHKRHHAPENQGRQSHKHKSTSLHAPENQGRQRPKQQSRSLHAPESSRRIFKQKSKSRHG